MTERGSRAFWDVMAPKWYKIPGLAFCRAWAFGGSVPGAFGMCKEETLLPVDLKA